MKKTGLLIFCCCLFSIINGQNKQWTLEECIRYAIDHNIAIKQIELEKENAEISLNTSQMSRLPNFNTGIDQTWSFGRTPTASGLYENTSQSNTSFSASSSIPLFTGFRIPNEIAKNQLDLKAATENLEKAKEDLSLNIAALFLQALFNKEIVKINEEQLRLSQSQVDKTNFLVETGKAPQAQLYDLEAQVAKDEVSLIQTKNNLALSLLDLAQSLELENTVTFDISVPDSKEVIEEHIGSILSPSVVFNNAMNSKPAVKAQEYRVESAKRNMQIARSGYLPTLNLSLGFGTGYYYNYDAKGQIDPITNVPINAPFFNQIKNKNRGETISLNLSIPVFNRFSVRNQVRSARLNIYNQQLALDNIKKTLYKEIQTAYLNATAAREKYKSSEKAVKASGESFKYAQERYETGKFSVFEYNEARTKWIQSLSEQAQAKYDFIFRSKILDFYNGIPLKL
jgi:outer membrane protein